MLTSIVHVYVMCGTYVYYIAFVYSYMSCIVYVYYVIFIYAAVYTLHCVFQDPVDLGWQPYVKTWLQRLPRELPEAAKQHLWALFEYSIEKGVYSIYIIIV